MGEAGIVMYHHSHAAMRRFYCSQCCTFVAYCSAEHCASYSAFTRARGDQGGRSAHDTIVPVAACSMALGECTKVVSKLSDSEVTRSCGFALVCSSCLVSKCRCLGAVGLALGGLQPLQ